MNIINKILKGDKVIWIIALVLGVISLVAVYSATSALVVNNYGGDTSRLLLKHGIYLLSGYACMLIAFSFNYKFYSKVSEILLCLTLLLLAYTLFFGRTINEASRTISVFGVSFQPSELAKIVLITYLARKLVTMGDDLKNFKHVLIYLGLPIFATAGLIFTENLSTALIIICVSLVVLFIGRVKFGHILALSGIGIAALCLVLVIDLGITNSHNTKKIREYEAKVASGLTVEKPRLSTSRFETWKRRLGVTGNDSESQNEEVKAKTFDPFDSDNYQRTYAKIAVATGNFLGKGPGKSEQRNFLPHPYSDFIFAIIIEEYGIFGALFVILLYVVFFTRVVRIVAKRPLTFGSIMSFGLGFLIILQAIINMGVSVGLLPVTGQPLPFVSLGGSSMLATGIIFGMILSVTYDINKEEDEKEIVQYKEIETNTENNHTHESAVESCD